MRLWRSLGLRWRLAIGAALAVVSGALLLSGVLYLTVGQLLWVTQQRQISSRAETAQLWLERRLDFFGGFSQENWPNLDDLAAQSPAMDGMEFRLIGEDKGEILLTQTKNFPDGIPADLKAGVYRADNVLVSVRVLRSIFGESPLLLTVTAETSAQAQVRQAFAQAFVSIFPGLLLFATGAGYLVAGGFLRPLRELSDAARRVAGSSDLRRALPHTRQNGELGELARELQGTFGRLAEARERERDFARAAAHDLRSPLAALTARVQGSLSRPRDADRYRQDLQEIGADLERLSSLTSHLLLLSRDAEAMARVSIAVQALVADAVDRARELDEMADVDFHICPSARGACLQGDAVLLGQAVWNLLVNAMKYGGGSPVMVSVSLQNDTLLLAVKDEGPGVSAAVLERLGQAFYRPQTAKDTAADDARTQGQGHGLGLALARRAAELHGGRLQLSSAPDEGFCATLCLPLSGEC